jgi:hypothetical protein
MSVRMLALRELGNHRETTRLPSRSRSYSVMTKRRSKAKAAGRHATAGGFGPESGWPGGRTPVLGSEPGEGSPG